MDNIIKIVTNIQASVYDLVESTIYPNIGGKKITPHEPKVILTPVAAPELE